MNKDVLVKVKGMQFGDEHSDEIEVICSGTYYNKNGKHYVKYEEVMEGVGSVTNMLKINNAGEKSVVEIRKHGSVSSLFIFERGLNHLSCYETEFGSFSLGLMANGINVRECDDEINVHIDYSLEMNQEHLSDNEIEIVITSK